MRYVILLGWLMSLAWGCGSDDDGMGAIVRFELNEAGPIAWDAVSFPSDLHLSSEGRVALATMPVDTPAWETARQTLNLRRGFCVGCGAWFPIDGEIDPASLPDEVDLSHTPSIDDAAVLMEVDPDTPEQPLLPVDVGWVARHGVVSVQYVSALEPGRRYALALTTSLRGADGTALAPAPLFEQVRDAGSGGGAAADRARPLYRAALDELEAAGLARDRVAGLAVFTADVPAQHLVALRTVADAPPAPAAMVDRVFMRDDGGVDLLWGTPEDNRPGRFIPAAAGTEGTRAIRHESTLAVVLGRLASPRIVEGSGSDVGRLIRDGAGNAVAGSETEEVPFMLIVPDVALDSLKVMIFHNAFISWLEFSAVMADTAGRHGVAVLGIEAFGHGSRSTTPNERGYWLRGEGDGEDDYLPTGETEGDGLFGHEFPVALRYFGLEGVPEDQKASPEYPVASGSQMLVDVLSTLRLVQEGDVSAVAGADPALAGLAFDTDSIFYSGWSLGGQLGMGAITAADGFAGAVLNVAPVPITKLTCAQNDVLTLIDLVGLRDLGFVDPPGRQRCFDPVNMLYAWYTEPIDPLAWAAALYRSPIAEGPRPDLLIQYASEDPVHPTARYLHVLDIPGVGEYGAGVAAPPSTTFSGNLMTAEGPVTAGAWQFAGADHGMLMEEDSDPEDEILNPIEDVHAQIEHFLATRIADGRSEIAPPP